MICLIEIFGVIWVCVWEGEESNVLIEDYFEDGFEVCYLEYYWVENNFVMLKE